MDTLGEVTTVPVLRIDPDLGAGIPASKLPQAERTCLAKVRELPRGDWDGHHGESGRRRGLGLLVLSGILCRRVAQSGHHGAEIVGPGDLLRPWDQIGEWSSIPTETEWLVLDDARLALLDADFTGRAALYPQIAEAAVRRALLRSRYLAVLTSIVAQRKVETRLTMLFWHLADRFGQMRGDWVQVPIPLTHAILGELVAARRPSVSTALTRLSENGTLTRENDVWLLRGSVPTELKRL